MNKFFGELFTFIFIAISCTFIKHSLKLSSLFAKALWDKTLEFRFLLQKPFSSSNRLPQVPFSFIYCVFFLLFLNWNILFIYLYMIYIGGFHQDPVRSSFCSSNEGVTAAYSDLITASKKTLDSLLELHEVWLFSRNLLRANLIPCFLIKHWTSIVIVDILTSSTSIVHFLFPLNFNFYCYHIVRLCWRTIPQLLNL